MQPLGVLDDIISTLGVVGGSIVGDLSSLDATDDVDIVL